MLLIELMEKLLTVLRIQSLFHLDTQRGKGSHVALYIDELRTTVQYGEIRKGTLIRMLKDLDIDRERF